MDGIVLANSTNIVKYIAVTSCSSCLSAAASHLCSQRSAESDVCLCPCWSNLPPLLLSHISSKQSKRICLQVWKLGSVKKSWSPGTHSLRSHNLSSACFEEEEHQWCQSCEYHQLTHCLHSFLLGCFPLPQSILHWPVSEPGFDKKEAERWIYIKHGLTMAVLKHTLITTVRSY